LAWSREKAKKWAILDAPILGASRFVCGDRLTIADYVGASIITLGEVIHEPASLAAVRGFTHR
jgi:glutathione S-transferase